jgi:hypothetical protein
MIWDDMANGCVSAGRNEDFWAACGNGARNRFAARGVPILCVQSVGVSTSSSAYARMMGHLADGAIQRLRCSRPVSHCRLARHAGALDR